MIKMFGFFIGVSIMIGILTALFQSGQSGVATTLTATISGTESTAVGVTSIAGFKTGSVIVIDREIIRYTGTTAAGGCPTPIPAASPCFTGITRSVGETSASAHLAGSTVFDQELGVSNLQMQHSYSSFSSDIESGSNVSINPFTWKDAMTSRVGNFVPTFLTGNWAYINIIFVFFMTLFLIIIALVMISAVRGVRLF